MDCAIARCKIKRCLSCHPSSGLCPIRSEHLPFLSAANYNSSPEQARLLKESHPGIEIFWADVYDREHVRRMVSEVISEMGRIDALVNNARGLKATEL